MKHALVIGGTGMLSRVSLWLAKHAEYVSVLGRSPDRMNRLLQSDGEGTIQPILVDYREEPTFRQKLKESIQSHGSIDLLVAWIHSDAPDAWAILLEEMSRNQDSWKLYHVLGSSKNLEEIRKNIHPPESCLYRQIQLGFIIEDDSARWLTHEEISDGVIKSIKQDSPVSIIGTLEPWHKRP